MHASDFMHSIMTTFFGKHVSSYGLHPGTIRVVSQKDGEIFALQVESTEILISLQIWHVPSAEVNWVDTLNSPPLFAVMLTSDDASGESWEAAHTIATSCLIMVLNAGGGWNAKKIREALA